MLYIYVYIYIYIYIYIFIYVTKIRSFHYECIFELKFGSASSDIERLYIRNMKYIMFLISDWLVEGLQKYKTQCHLDFIVTAFT